MTFSDFMPVLLVFCLFAWCGILIVGNILDIFYRMK